MNMLLAVDGSDYTRHMVSYLVMHQLWQSPQDGYTLLHVVPAVPPHAAAALSHDIVQDYYSDEAEAVFGPLRALFEEHGVTVRCVSRVGHAADHIATMAQEGRFDLVVMGSHGHGALANLVLGSVATKVLAHCKVPLLIVR